MSDILQPTFDVSIFSADGSRVADVRSATNNQLYVYDPDVVAAITTGSQSLWQSKTIGGNAFQYTTNTITIAGTAEVDFLLIKNPNASGKTVRIQEISYSNVKGASTAYGIVRYYRDPTITANGTLGTINKALKSQATASVISIYRAPTISARNTILRVYQNIQGTTRNPSDLGLLIEPNENILLTIQPSVTNNDHAIDIDWIEV